MMTDHKAEQVGRLVAYQLGNYRTSASLNCSKECPDIYGVNLRAECEAAQQRSGDAAEEVDMSQVRATACGHEHLGAKIWLGAVGVKFQFLQGGAKQTAPLHHGHRHSAADAPLLAEWGVAPVDIDWIPFLEEITHHLEAFCQASCYNKDPESNCKRTQ